VGEVTDPIDRFLAEERAAAIAQANGEPLPSGWSVVTGTELHAAELQNAAALKRWKRGRRKKKYEPERAKAARKGKRPDEEIGLDGKVD
jgi:hypothetical protein